MFRRRWLFGRRNRGFTAPRGVEMKRSTPRATLTLASFVFGDVFGDDGRLSNAETTLRHIFPVRSVDQTHFVEGQRCSRQLTSPVGRRCPNEMEARVILGP